MTGSLRLGSQYATGASGESQPGGVQRVDSLGTPFAPVAPPMTLPEPIAPATPPTASPRMPLPGWLRPAGTAVTLPLMLSGDTPRPHTAVSGRPGLGIDLGTPGTVTLRRSGVPVMQLPAELRQDAAGVQGRVLDADGRTVGTFHDGVLHLQPEAERRLDTILDAMTDGAGLPPRTTDADAAGCEDPPRGEPGRSAGADPVDARDPVPDALRADSGRARDLVRQSDPIINNPLVGLRNSDWQAHHLITREAASSQDYGDIFDAASRAGWKEDSRGNVVGLPTNCAAQERMARYGVHRPLHTGSHPTWNADVIVGLRDIRTALSNSGFTEGSAEYGLEARSLLEALQSRLRATLGGMDRVVELPNAPSPVG